jgi:hypothetical protein
MLGCLSPPPTPTHLPLKGFRSSSWAPGPPG